MAVGGGYFGNGSDTVGILLDDLMCSGSESSLLDCPRRDDASINMTNCDHSEDAGVICEGKGKKVIVKFLYKLVIMFLTSSTENYTIIYR